MKLDLPRPIYRRITNGTVLTDKETSSIWTVDHFIMEHRSWCTDELWRYFDQYGQVMIGYGGVERGDHLIRISIMTILDNATAYPRRLVHLLWR